MARENTTFSCDTRVWTERILRNVRTIKDDVQGRETIQYIYIIFN